jgi:GT2 family glycosyltransferase
MQQPACDASTPAPIRVCVFLPDLGDIAARSNRLLQQLRELTGSEALDISYVGYRQTQPLDAEVQAYQPYIVPAKYTRVRIANTVLRMIGASLAPAAAASGALRVCAPAFVEAILACDPDLVLLDVSWGRALQPWLVTQFGGPIRLAHECRPITRQELQWGGADPSVTVSIVLPTHNGSRYLRQSIQSCLDQSHRNIELIVVDDGSSEDIRAVVDEFFDTRLHYVRHATNRGLPAALNTGFALASGSYLTWTSDDNFYATDAIERMTRFLQRHPDVAFVYSSSYILDESGDGRPARIRRPLPPADLLTQNSVGGCFLYRRQVYREIGEYDSGAILVEDYDYWVRVSRRFRMQRLFAPLYYYRYHDESLTARHGREDVAQRFEVVRQRNRVASFRRQNDQAVPSPGVAASHAAGGKP